jgi:phage I-like protein
MHRTAPLTAALGLALAACALELPAVAADAKFIKLQVLPAGEFRPMDGRPMVVPAWRIDAASAARVIEARGRRTTPPVIDYEHQTLNKEKNGQPAPAAAWIGELEWHEGKGLFATVELTARARDLIRAREYLFFSPVFTFSPATGDVLEVLMGAFTNTPAIDGMAAVELQAAASRNFLTPNPEDPSMTKLLVAVAAALALPQAATEDQAITALSQVKPLTDSFGELRKALGLDEKADAKAVVAACAALKTRADAEPDPAKYVPVAALTQLQTQFAALSAKVTDGEVDQVVQAALEDGRLIAGEQEKWARELGKKDLAALNAFLKTAQPIAALSGTQTRGKTPAGSSSGGDDPAVIAAAAAKYQSDQAAAGVTVTTTQAVDHVINSKKGA